MLGFEAYTLSLIRSTNWKLVDVELLGFLFTFQRKKKVEKNFFLHLHASRREVRSHVTSFLTVKMA